MTIDFFNIIEEKLKGKKCKFICSQKNTEKNFIADEFEKINFFDKNKNLICIQVKIKGVSQKKFVNIWFCHIELIND